MNIISVPLTLLQTRWEWGWGGSRSLIALEPFSLFFNLKSFGKLLSPFYISSILLIFLLSCSLLAFPSCWWQMCSDTILFSLLYKRQRPHSYTERSEASHVQTAKVCKLKSTFRNHQPSQPLFGTIWKIPMFPRNSNLRHFSVRQSVLLKIIELGAWVRLVRGEVSKREFVISEQR